jgi:hypothetical protein
VSFNLSITKWKFNGEISEIDYNDKKKKFEFLIKNKLIKDARVREIIFYGK